MLITVVSYHWWRFPYKIDFVGLFLYGNVEQHCRSWERDHSFKSSGLWKWLLWEFQASLEGNGRYVLTNHFYQHVSLNRDILSNKCQELVAITHLLFFFTIYAVAPVGFIGRLLDDPSRLWCRLRTLCKLVFIVAPFLASCCFPVTHAGITRACFF